MYADDTHLTYRGSSVDNIQFYLNQDLLEKATTWLVESKQANSKYDRVYAHWIKAETE